MPSKALLRSADVAHIVETAPQVGIMPNGLRADVHALIARKRRIIKSFADERVEGINAFPLFRGAPRFESPGTLLVGEQSISADVFLISTGSLINVPQISGLAETGYLTSDEVLDAASLPQSIVVLGGGAVACELSQYYGRLGVRTTVLQRSHTLLSSEDAEVGEAVRMAFEKENIAVITAVHIDRVERAGNKKRVIAEVDGDTAVYEADEIFVALGRRPNVDGFCFDRAGIDFDHHGVKVDDYLLTSNPHVYAAGDVTGMSRELVHLAVYEGKLAVRNAFMPHQRKAVDYALHGARAIFTEPQVAVAGKNERECQRQGLACVSAAYPFHDHGKAIIANLTEGFVKMLAAPDGRILGVTYVGAEASDLIQEAVALLYFGATVQDVLEMPHLHPTMAEILSYPAEMLAARVGAPN
jgi:pyruvate/2-oxoglutarate dehydrogenase complex dihydrolipoamide dehydrogenase (E3) component